MISFRYHLVSIVAVFLALALGIVVGTTALNGPITKDLRNQVNDTKDQRDRLAAQVKSLQGQVSDAGQFASTYGAQLVAGRLKGRSVLVVSMPGTTQTMRNGVRSRIAAAGATVSGQVSLTKDYIDASQGNAIVTLATTNHPIDITLPETSDPAQLSAALLGFVLVGKGQPSDLTQVLGGFSQLHMVDADAGLKASTDVVVIAKGSMAKDSYAQSSELAFVNELAKKGGHVVVAGDDPSADKSGLVGLVRAPGGNRTGVATVDNADSAFGQVSAVLSLADAIGGRVGHYGTQNGADALFPAPAS
ncbi:copper transporter [uncultured Jatrophihabitans sp.]|uniref:copper transporter n=1 Tax=uncultured Jatrophihabitans sp. TaxID=1610747 RepID=UPI0035CC752E